MSALPKEIPHDRSKYIGGYQSTRVKSLNEGIIRHLYESGMTQIEIAKELNTTQRSVCLFMIKCGIEARIAAKRNQFGENNHTWKGKLVTYKSAHSRVYAARGRPMKCEHCGTTNQKFKYDWANVSGNYHDPGDYIRLCRSCHCKYDGLIKNLGEYAKEPKNARN